MAAPSRSQLMREYHGVASADKEEGSRELYVYSEELLPFLTGELHATEHENDISTSNGKNSYSGTLKTTNSLKCLYRDTQSNTAFPPPLRKGEQVTIYNLGDTSTWYWKSEGRNDNLRRLDTVRYSVSGTRQNTPELDDDNTYFLELDSRIHKRVRISTSSADGEQFRYMLELSPENNQAMLSDSAGNMIGLQSDIPRVFMKNSTNSLLDLNMENIIMACKGNITLKTDEGDITFASGKDINLVATSNYSLKFNAQGSMTSSSGGTMTLKFGSMQGFKI